MLADKLVELKIVDSIFHETVGRTLKNEIKPWLRKEWVIPPGQSGAFVAAMEEVLDVYKRPCSPKKNVVYIDEMPRSSSRKTAGNSLIKRVLCTMNPSMSEMGRQMSSWRSNPWRGKGAPA